MLHLLSGVSVLVCMEVFFGVCVYACVCVYVFVCVCVLEDVLWLAVPVLVNNEFWFVYIC